MQTRSKTYIWIIIILLATNLATIGSILYHLNEDKKAAEETEIQMPRERRTRFFKQQLDLNQEQHNQFREFNRTFNRTAKPIVNELEGLRFEMLEELGKTESDTATLENIAAEIGKLHEELKQTTITFYLNMKSICNNDQSQKLYKIFRTMLKEEDVKLPQRNHQSHHEHENKGCNITNNMNHQKHLDNKQKTDTCSYHSDNFKIQEF